jgi:hypothetical protein
MPLMRHLFSAASCSRPSQEIVRCVPNMARRKSRVDAYGVIWREIMNTKMLAAAAALATMIASPGWSQTVNQPPPGARPAPDETFGQARPPRAAPYFAEDIQTDGRRRFTNPANDVYLGDRYLGSDPDPTVRLELRRDIVTEY